MAERLNVFVVVKGHDFSRDAFIAMLRAIAVEATMVDQPAAATMLNPEAMRPYDAILLYDMPGLDFRAPVDERPGFLEPAEDFQRGFASLLEEGKGIVALHHAIAGWPAWDAYGKALGGRFLYKPARVGDIDLPDSGYAPDVSYTARIARNGHPVLKGLPDRFNLVDELYLNHRFDDPTLVPLLYFEKADMPVTFQSAMRAVRRMSQDGDEEADERPYEPLIGWSKAADNSPVVYLQPGDSARTYEDANYRRLIANALRWVASSEASEWVHRQKVQANTA